jgi:hypothetical protein
MPNPTTLAELVRTAIERYTNNRSGILGETAALDYVYSNLPRGYAKQLAFSGIKREFAAFFRKLDSTGNQERGGLWDLHTGYRVGGSDDEGDMIFAYTSSLNKLQFVQAIRLRRKQLRADMKSIEELENAYDAVSLLWDRHPQMNFGQICRLYADERRAA